MPEPDAITVSNGRRPCRACGGEYPPYYVNAHDVCFECALVSMLNRPGLDARTVSRIEAVPCVIPAAGGEAVATLTARQQDVYHRLAAGLSVAAISRADGRNERATRKLVARIRMRLAAA